MNIERKKKMRETDFAAWRPKARLRVQLRLTRQGTPLYVQYKLHRSLAFCGSRVSNWISTNRGLVFVGGPFGL